MAPLAVMNLWLKSGLELGKPGKKPVLKPWIAIMDTGIEMKLKKGDWMEWGLRCSMYF